MSEYIVGWRHAFGSGVRWGIRDFWLYIIGNVIGNVIGNRVRLVAPNKSHGGDVELDLHEEDGVLAARQPHRAQQVAEVRGRQRVEAVLAADQLQTRRVLLVLALEHHTYE
eukprot:1194713-Prorocentrum_minimum.AAC.2